MHIFKKTPKEYRATSLSALTWQRFKKEREGMVSLAFILLVIIVSILGYLITPDPTPYCNRQQLEIALRSPGFKVDMLQVKHSQEVVRHKFLYRMLFGQPDQYRSVPISAYEDSGDTVEATLFEQQITVHYAKSALAPKPVVSRRFLLGTDRYGRDVLSQLMIGSRVSLAVGFLSIFIALVIGITVGAIAGYFRGKVDDVLTFIINVVWSIPTLLLVIAISFALGKGFWQIFIAIGLTMWVDIARVVRGQVISLREQDFVESGKALGYSSARIIFKHILPNITGT